MSVNKTKSVSLQSQLDHWLALLKEAISAGPYSSDERNEVINQFARCFVPIQDITDDDFEYFTTNLCSDEEYFLGIARDIDQCANGIGVESITGNQRTKAVFTLIPVDAKTSLNIAREVAFISLDKGITWRAEVIYSLGTNDLFGYSS